ncbi:MAG: hypothetical protein ACK55I_01980, partial [bacterium]
MDGFRMVLEVSGNQSASAQSNERSLEPQLFLGKTFGDCEKYLGPPGQVLAPKEGMPVHTLVYA